MNIIIKSTLCFFAVVVMLNPSFGSDVVLTYDATHTGQINESPFMVSVDGTVDGSTGVVNGIMNVGQSPAGDYHVGFSGVSYWCISCSNNWHWPWADEGIRPPSVYDILEGSGTYTHTRTYTYEGYPDNYLILQNADFTLSPDRLEYTGTWVGNTNGLPTDIVDVGGYSQTLIPLGGGSVQVIGSTEIIRASGDPIRANWVGTYELGFGNDPPSVAIGMVDLDFTETAPGMYSITGYTYGVPEPTTICLLGLGSLALLRRRKA